jgi:hypothetical protein
MRTLNTMKMYRHVSFAFALLFASQLTTATEPLTLGEHGTLMLPTWCTGDVSFDLIPIHAPGGVDFGWVFAGLKAVGYDGTVTVHQSAQPGETPEESASGTADFLRGLI